MSKIEVKIPTEFFQEGYQFFVDGKHVPNKQARIDNPFDPLILSPKGVSDFFVDQSYALFGPKIDNLEEQMGWDEIYPVLKRICQNAKELGLPCISINEFNMIDTGIHDPQKLDWDKTVLMVSFTHEKKTYKNENDEITSVGIIFDTDAIKEAYLSSVRDYAKKIEKAVGLV